MVTEFRELKPVINNLHKSPMDRLPVEIISIIFGYFVEKPDFIPSPVMSAHNLAYPQQLTLGAVCSNWRRIAWSLPSLWTSLAFQFTTSTSYTRVRLAVEWLERSGRLPVDIILSTPDNPGSFKQPDLSRAMPLIRAVNLCSDRWRSLTLFLPQSFMSFIHDANGPPPMLLHLHVNSHDVASLDISQTAPKSVHIANIPLEELSMKWHEVTRISTSNFYDAHDCLQILRQATKVEQCFFYLKNGGDPTSNLIVNCQLTCLDVTFYSGHNIAFFFDHITLPALKSLTLNDLPFDILPVNSLVSFFRRSSCQLDSLCLDDPFMFRRDAMELMSAIPSVSDLSLHFRIPGRESNISLLLGPFYQSLASLTDIQGRSLLLLPRLKTLNVSGYFSFPDKLIAALYHRLRLSKRDKAAQQSLDHVRIVCRTEDDEVRNPISRISQSTLDQILYLQKEGVEFKIEVHSGPHRRQDLLEMSLEDRCTEEGVQVGPSDTAQP
ncbi:hypothetical protein CVT26_009134 [Gymnopilus dilepis]|uniref:F-box domain-containing protein n=1 Tax=Gymnopilus dilepis TaxID=231916 RepID=A0A409YRJ8_9AGAR|nr:hypothetical protein CVT26_009134 [Gymnopilus dilepis]